MAVVTETPDIDHVPDENDSPLPVSALKLPAELSDNTIETVTVSSVVSSEAVVVSVLA